MIKFDLDKYMVARGIEKYPPNPELYTPEQAISGYRLYNTNPRGFRAGARGLAIVFPPWHNGEPAVDVLEKRLAWKNWTVLGLRFHGGILSPDSDQVLESFAQIQDSVTNLVNPLIENHRYQGVHLIGMSLGNISLALCAGKLKRFSSAQLVVGGSDLARFTWEGTRTQPIRNEFESHGVTKQLLTEAWAELAPANHAKAFAGKPVELITSPSDLIIPGPYQAELANSMSEADANVTVRQYSEGHYGTVIKFCLRGTLPNVN